MIACIVLLMLSLMKEDKTLVDFEMGIGTQNWVVINDGVMGGLSNSKFVFDDEKTGVFSGRVSLENNGGFASVRHQTEGINLNGHSSFRIYVKGDGKRYQLRVKKNRDDYFSYVYYFTTSTEWEYVTVPFDQLEPAFRGNKLDQPSFDGRYLDELGFLIGNGKNESFTLAIKHIKIS